MVAALELESLSKSFRAGFPGCIASARVLESVSLRLAAGEVVGVAGEPGAGKTTLLLCAAGLLRPDRGHVRWFGGHAARPNAAASAIVFIGAPSPRPAARLREGVGGGGERAAGERWTVGNDMDGADAPARVVLADDPPLLRDARPGSGFARLLCDFAAAGGAVLLTSRDPKALATVATRILLLRGGRLVELSSRPSRRSVAER
jgi:ABC-type multidrug transport system ATPase subunit